MINKITKRLNKGWFFFVLLFMVIDLGRPQDILPISFLRPGLLTTVILLCYLTAYGWSKIIYRRQERLVLFFVGLMFVHVPFAANTFWAFGLAKGMLLFVPFLLSIRVLIDSKDIFVHFLTTLSYISLYVAIYSLLHQGMGSGGWIKDENDITLFFVFIIPLVLFLLGQAERFSLKMVFIIILSVLLLSIVTSFSRGGFVGFIMMCATYWWFSKRKLLGIAVLILAFVIIYSFGGDKYIAEMSTVTDTNESTASARLLSWEAGWYMFLDNPLGVGSGNFSVLFPQYQPPELLRNMWGRAAHSLWFTLLPELGVPGIILYTMLIWTNISVSFKLINYKDETGQNSKLQRSLGVSFLASLIGFFGCASFISVLYYPYFWYLTFLLLVASDIFLIPNDPINTQIDRQW